MREIGHFIGGKQVAGTSGRVSNVYNPATGEVQATVALASVEELRAAVENAKLRSRNGPPPIRSAAPASSSNSSNS